MKKIKSTLPNIVMSLTSICLAAGVALSAANEYTEKIIAETKYLTIQNAIRQVAPAFDNNPVKEQYKIAVTGGDTLTLYPAKKGGKIVGCAVESYSKNGFSGLIRIIAGFDADNRLHNYTVLEHHETPGLGSKMEEWFRNNKNRQNIIGYDFSKGLLKVIKDGGDVDAITAATISSRAFLEAINRAYFAFTDDMEALNEMSNNGADGQNDRQRFRRQRTRQQTRQPGRQPRRN